MRGGQFFECNTQGLISSLEDCQLSQTDSPHLMYIRDEGTMLRRLLSAFSFKPTHVTTRPVYSMTGLVPPIQKLDQLSMINVVLPHANLVNAEHTEIPNTSIMSGLNVPHWYLENGVVIPKQQQIVYSREVIFFYVNRRYQSIHSMYNSTYQFQRLPVATGGFDRLNTHTVDWDPVYPIHQSKYYLRSVLCMRPINWTQQYKGQSGGATAHVQKENTAADNYHNVYNGCYTILVEPGNHYENDSKTRPGSHGTGSYGHINHEEDVSKIDIWVYDPNLLVLHGPGGGQHGGHPGSQFAFMGHYNNVVTAKIRNLVVQIKASLLFQDIQKVIDIMKTVNAAIVTVIGARGGANTIFPLNNADRFAFGDNVNGSAGNAPLTNGGGHLVAQQVLFEAARMGAGGAAIVANSLWEKLAREHDPGPISDEQLLAGIQRAIGVHEIAELRRDYAAKTMDVLQNEYNELLSPIRQLARMFTAGHDAGIVNMPVTERIQLIPIIQEINPNNSFVAAWDNVHAGARSAAQQNNWAGVFGGALAPAGGKGSGVIDDNLSGDNVRDSLLAEIFNTRAGAGHEFLELWNGLASIPTNITAYNGRNPGEGFTRTLTGGDPSSMNSAEIDGLLRTKFGTQSNVNGQLTGLHPDPNSTTDHKGMKWEEVVSSYGTIFVYSQVMTSVHDLGLDSHTAGLIGQRYVPRNKGGLPA